MMNDVMTCHRFVAQGPETFPRRRPHKGCAAQQKHIEESMFFVWMILNALRKQKRLKKKEEKGGEMFLKF